MSIIPAAIHEEKFSFAPTSNFQFGISRTVLFGGKGAPVTASTFLRSVFSTGIENEQNNPGDRRSAFDAEYRIPGLRNCLTGYFDAFTDDEPFPLNYLSGYTTSRQIIGSWIGREGREEQLWATWQVSPRTSVELSGSSMNISNEFLRSGSLRDLPSPQTLPFVPIGSPP